MTHEERDSTDGHQPPADEPNLRYVPPDPTHRDPPDDALAQRIADGDAVALRQMMDRYDRLVRYTIFRQARDRCTKDPQWLDSVASDAWTGFVRSMEMATDFPANLPTYLIQLTRHKCVDALRSRSGRLIGDIDSIGDAQPAASQEDTLELLAREEDVSALRECMRNAPPEDRRILAELELVVARRWREAAERLGMAESTLRSKWNGVVARLKQCLGRKTEKRFAPPPPGRDSLGE